MIYILSQDYEEYIDRYKYQDVLACTPPTPVGGLGGYMSKMSAPTPQPPPELKNVSKIFYTKYFFKIL